MYSRLLAPTLLAASSLTMMAGALIAPSLPDLYVHFAGVAHGELLVKLVLTMPAIFIALLAPVAGLIVDRWGRKNVLVASTLLYAVAGTSGYFIDWLPGILAGRAFLGVAVAGVMTTCMTLVGDYFEGEARQRFLGMQNAFMGFGGAVILSLGGLLASTDWRTPFLVYLVALVFLPFIMLVLHEPARPAPQAEDSPLAAVPAPWTTIGLVYFLSLIGMVGFYIIPVQLPFLLKGLMGATPTQSGLAIATCTLFSALMSLAFPRVTAHLTNTQVLAVSFTGMGAAFLLVFLSHAYWQIVVSMAVMGMAMGLHWPNVSLWLMAIAPAPLRGRLMGGMTTSLFLGQFLSPVVSQPLSQAVGLGPAFGIIGAGMLTLGAFAAVGSVSRFTPESASPMS